MKYYTMHAPSISEEYIRIDETEFADIYIHCINSEIQHLDRSPMLVHTSDNGGIMFPDFIYEYGVPLFSQRFYDTVLKTEADYLFTKKVDILCDVISEKRTYILALPPRINCLDPKRSVCISEDDEPFALKIAEHCVIDPQKTGRFDIFKIDGVTDNNIYVTERFKNNISSANFVNVCFLEAM